jgi:hypothetical protein
MNMHILGPRSSILSTQPQWYSLPRWELEIVNMHSWWSAGFGPKRGEPSVDKKLQLL